MARRVSWALRAEALASKSGLFRRVTQALAAPLLALCSLASRSALRTAPDFPAMALSILACSSAAALSAAALAAALALSATLALALALPLGWSTVGWSTVGWSLVI